MARQTKNSATIDRLLGKTAEPKYEKIESQSEVASALNWYNSNKDAKSAAKWIAEYAKKNKIPGRVNTSKSYTTTGFLCRMLTNGTIFSDEVKQDILKRLSDVLTEESKETVVVEKTTPTVSIQDRLAEKVSEIAGELEGSIDDYILSKFAKTPSPYGIMHDKVKAMHSAKIIEIFKKRRAEFDEVLTTDDEQIKEGYSNFSKPEIKKLVAYCDLIITDAMKLGNESKSNRKPRKRKSKTPEQLTAKVQYCAKDETYKLESESPKGIIGATSLWLFNVKTRKLGVYHALDSQGFGVKGTSLTNFSEMKSVQKTLRKPEAILPDVVKGAKLFLRGVMDSIKSKDAKLNGRLNKDTVLLKIIR
jgi:hypothetical protein